MNRFITRFRAMSLRRRAATVLSAAAAAALLVTIFLLSAEGKAASGGRSGRVTGWLVTLFCGSELTEEAHSALVQQWGHTIRKLAHMTEYAALTASLTALTVFARPLRENPRRWVEWVVPFGVCAVYAASDEIHQIFSNRGPAVLDVLIDCAGGLIGLCVMQALVFAASRYRARLRAKASVSGGGNTLCS